MTGLNPVGMMGITKLGSFDFPVKVHANGCLPNVDPQGIHPHIETWYGQFGDPKRQQGWPVIIEDTPEVEDPNVAPWIDMIIDIDQPATIYHTGRLSGSMAVEVADNTHYSRIIAHAVPYKGGSAVQLLDVTQQMSATTNQANHWFWYTNGAKHELVQTRQISFDPAQMLKAGEVYKLLIEWEFYHEVNGTRHHEPFCGFDDSITFKVNEATVE